MDKEDNRVILLDVAVGEDPGWVKIKNRRYSQIIRRDELFAKRYEAAGAPEIGWDMCDRACAAAAAPDRPTESNEDVIRRYETAYANAAEKIAAAGAAVRNQHCLRCGKLLFRAAYGP